MVSLCDVIGGRQIMTLKQEWDLKRGVWDCLNHGPKRKQETLFLVSHLDGPWRVNEQQRSSWKK